MLAAVYSPGWHETIHATVGLCTLRLVPGVLQKEPMNVDPMPRDGPVGEGASGRPGRRSASFQLRGFAAERPSRLRKGSLSQET